MDFQGKPNIDQYVRIRTSVEVRNCTESELLSKIQGRESLIFQIYVTFSIDFPNTYDHYLLANVTDSFSRYFDRRRRFLPHGTYGFLTSSVHVPLNNTVVNQR